MTRLAFLFPLRWPQRFAQWAWAEYGPFRAHRPKYEPITVPPLPPHLQADSPTLDLYLAFIKETFTKEEERKTVLEGKAAQLLGQAGLVLSLVGILIPLLADSLTKQPWILGPILGLFGITMLLFTNAVYHAASLTKVWGWRYMQPGAQSLFKEFDLSADSASAEGSFKSMLVRDYYQSFKYNETTNNQKANYLSYAANSFTSALLLMGLLVALLSLGLLLKSDEPSEVRLVNEPIVHLAPR